MSTYAMSDLHGNYEAYINILRKINAETVAKIDEEMIEKLLNWQQNGAVSTTDEFHKCDKHTQRTIVDFISDFEVYDEIEVGGKMFILVHAGLGNFEPDKEMWEYELDELVWKRPDYETNKGRDKIHI